MTLMARELIKMKSDRRKGAVEMHGQDMMDRQEAFRLAGTAISRIFLYLPDLCFPR